jgi:SAM-dependent methyltransferase
VAEEDCPIRFPGYLARRDPAAVRHAAYEIAMLADILAQSQLTAGDHMIEYGAGAGVISVTLSRLGVAVDTVDISATYCEHVQRNADFYGTALKPHNAEFGYNPRGPGGRYDCIVFHACFHHALAHQELVGQLAGMLADDGVILLSNESILDRVTPAWGLKSDPESISVIAARGWMELEFSFPYLAELFRRNGLQLRKVEGNFSGLPLFKATRLPRTFVHQAAIGLAALVDAHAPEPNGTWTRRSSRILVQRAQGAHRLRVEMFNPFPLPKQVVYQLGGFKRSMLVRAGARDSLDIDLPPQGVDHDADLVFTCDTHRPSQYLPGNTDERELGIYVTAIVYPAGR